MEFLNQTFAVFVTKSLLLKLSKHVDYTLADDKDICCFVSVTSTLPVHGTKSKCFQNKGEFQMWLFFRFILLLFCYLVC